MQKLRADRLDTAMANNDHMDSGNRGTANWGNWLLQI